VRLGSSSKMISVKPEDILPMKKRETPLESQQRKFKESMDSEMSRAITRYDKFLIQPQKEIFRNAIYESDDGSIDVGDVLDKIDKLYGNVTDLRARIGEKFDVAASIDGVRTLEEFYIEGASLDDFTELEILKREGLYDEHKTRSKYADMDVESLVWDEEEEEAPKPVQPQVTKDKEEDTYAIDPSLLEED